MSPSELIFSIIITWGVGLAPALVARYLWFKLPIRRRTATWIAGVSCASFWIGTRALNAAAGVEPGETTQGFVWLAIFFVSRWLMNRGCPPDVAEVPQNATTHTRAEMIVRLEAMVADPGLTEDERAAAAERLDRLQPSSRS